MLRRLPSLLISGLMAVGFSTAGVLANPGTVLAVTCSANFLIGPYYSTDPHPLVQASVQINCPGFGRGGDKIQLQIIKYATGSVVADSGATPVCGAGCDTHHINAFAQSNQCSGSTATWYFARWRDYYDDKFGWEGWTNGVIQSLTCSL